MLVFLLIAALVALRSAANLRTKREELRKLQKKLSRAKRTSDSRAINELESQISALRDDIDGIAPKVEESTPLPLPKKAPPPPEKVVETPSPPRELLPFRNGGSTASPPLQRSKVWLKQIMMPHRYESISRSGGATLGKVRKSELRGFWIESRHGSA